MRRHAPLLLAACVVVLALLVTAAPASAGSGYGERRMEIGMRGDDVKRLQKLLSELGFKTQADGDFGPATEKSVKGYERSREWPVDGVVTKREAEKIRNRARNLRERDADEPDSGKRTFRYGERVLKRGKRGPDVEKLQRLLTRMAIKTAVDGSFGPGTEKSVKGYERWQGKRPDGIVTTAQARKMEKLADRGERRPRKPRRKHAFPVRGPYSFGGDGSRFGAPRGGRSHKGQDIAAASGTRLVSVHRGTVWTRQYQAGGAGYYVVIHGADGSDSVYMHMLGPAVVASGERVKAGQTIGSVGSTGSSTGPHLHFELWTPHWFDGGYAYDPLPKLKRWAE